MDEIRENTPEILQQWFEKDLLTRLIAQGKLPVPDAACDDIIVNSIDYEGTQRGIDHFASLPYFAKVSLQDKNNSLRTKEYSLLVKFINQKLAVRQAMETDTQFYNEMIFYNEVMLEFKDFLKDRPAVSSDFVNLICPVCRYAHIDLNSPEYGVVIMDDLRQDGYTCAESKVELDLDHCLLSVEMLAKFHAISLAMQLENPEQLKKLSTRFVECRYQDERYKAEMNNNMFRKCGMRAIQYLMAQDNCAVPKSYLILIADKLDSGMYKQMQNFVEPNGPISVICHGDFCRNNILYKFENGKPTDCKLFDFQTWRYSSPAIDLSFFICMNTTLQLRQAHFDEIFDCYYKNLIGTVALITGRPVDSIETLYPRNILMKDYGEHALFGFAIAAFFLPSMMAPKENAGDFEDEWTSCDWNEIVDRMVEQGGERVTKRIAEIIIDFYQRKFYL